jgi:hypothetical protein
MATGSNRTMCCTCDKQKPTYSCRGCNKDFCFVHLQEHRQVLNGQLDGIINEHDQFRHTLEEQSSNPPLVKRIDQWEQRSIETIRTTAEECRQALASQTRRILDDINGNLDQFRRQLKNIGEENEFNEIDLERLTNELIKTKEEFTKLSRISIGEDAQTLIRKIHLTSSIPGYRGGQYLK